VTVEPSIIHLLFVAVKPTAENSDDQHKLASKGNEAAAGNNKNNDAISGEN
jgi:hypothetical protein